MDPLADFAARLYAELGVQSAERIRAVEAEVRSRWGGDWVYVRKRPFVDQRQLREQWIAGESVQSLSSRYGITRRWVRRIVGA